MTEYKIGDTVRFKTIGEYECIGTIHDYYEHNKLYEIKIEKKFDIPPENDELDPTAGVPVELIYEVIE